MSKYRINTTIAARKADQAMKQLQPGDYAEAINIAVALLEPDTHEGFVNALVNHMHKMMNAAVTGYNETDSAARRFSFLVHPRNIVNDEMIAAWVQHASENPVLKHVLHNPTDLRVHKISDFMPIREFRQTNLCREVYRPMNAENQIALPIVFENTCAVAIVFNRRIDFSERERQRLMLMQPLIIGIYKKFRRLEDIAAASLENVPSPSPAAPVADQYQLPPRLRQVLALLIKGESNAQIAKQLKLSVRTIEKYVETTLMRMNVPSRSAAIAKALRVR